MFAGMVSVPYQSHQSGIETAERVCIHRIAETTNRTNLELKLVLKIALVPSIFYQSHQSGIETWKI